MYSEIKSIQIVVSLLKEFGIKDVVLSPGGSDIPLIHSIECDSFFECYSVVDERSAAYYAMGIAQVKNRPCVCVCTSGTAVCNYVPGITEAYYQDVPILAITCDKNPYYQDQLEIQKIKQTNIFGDVVKKSVELPIIKSEDDEWLCNRLVNEAILALNHHGTGPVQINIPIVGRTSVYNCEILPKQRKITRFSNDIKWESLSKELRNKKIMIVVGQNIVFNEYDINNMSSFFEKYDCMFAVENLSNYEGKGAIFTYPVTEMCNINSIEGLKPDIVISLGNNLSAYKLKPFLRANYKYVENWLVHENGAVRDAYKSLRYIFECSPSVFFEKICEISKSFDDSSHTYYSQWLTAVKNINLPELTFSNFYVAKRLSSIIPQNSVLHMAILNSTRIMQFFELKEGIKSYSNVGALGIDGCFSTFAGQAAATQELAFLVIGDLSFFYDMNAAGLRSIGSNVRVILLNNGGGSEFHFFMGRKNIETINNYICAEHSNVATGWIVSLGYDYYSASTKDEFDNVIEKLAQPSDKPIFIEVFTDMEEEAERTNKIYDMNNQQKKSNIESLKGVAKSILPQSKINKVKEIIRILKEK